jgi:hypothetical protein
MVCKSNKFFQSLVLLLSLGYLQVQPGAENCPWLSWQPDFSGRIWPELSQKYPLTYHVLHNHNIDWYGGDIHGFIYSCLRNKSKRQALIKQFFGEKSYSVDEATLAKMNDEEFFEFFNTQICQSMSPQEKENLLTEGGKPEDLFRIELIYMAIARANTYKMFVINELCRKSFDENLECPKCLELSVKRVQAQLEKKDKQGSEEQSPKDFVIRLCPQHKNRSKTAQGVFSSMDASSSNQPEDKPALDQNPSLEGWRQLEEAGAIAQTSPAFATDLKLFVGDEPEYHQSLMLRIKRTQTNYGYAFFDYMFATPSNDYQTLLNRQTLVKELSQDDELYNRLRTALDKIERCQVVLNAFIFNQPLALTNKELLLYPEGSKPLEMFEMVGDLFAITPLKRLLEHANRNKLAIFAARPLKAWIELFAIITPIATILAGHNGLISKIMKLQEVDKGVATQTKRLPTLSEIKAGSIDYFGSRGTETGSQYAWIPKGLLFLAGGVSTLFLMIKGGQYLTGAFESLGALVHSGFKTKKAISNVSKTSSALNQARKAVEALRDFWNATLELHNALSEFKGNKAALTLVGDLHEFASRKSELTEKMKGISKNPSFASVLSVFRSTFPLRWQLARPLEAIGQIDAFMAAATLVREHQAAKNSYCFSDFRKSAQPGFALEEFWNPYLLAAEAVPNCLSLGFEKSERNMLLCGPNAGGKSTILRAAASCILMSQVFGIAPAKSCSFSIYDCFASSMTTKDNPAEKKSLFMVQAESIDRIRKLLAKNAGQQKLSFVTIDEIYGGTGAQSAVPMGLTFGLEAAQNLFSTLLVSSHFFEMSEIEPMSQGTFRNFKVIKEVGLEGQVKMTYKLAVGKPDRFNDAVGIEVAENCGVDAGFISKAKALKQKLYRGQ